MCRGGERGLGRAHYSWLHLSSETGRRCWTERRWSEDELPSLESCAIAFTDAPSGWWLGDRPSPPEVFSPGESQEVDGHRNRLNYFKSDMEMRAKEKAFWAKGRKDLAAGTGPERDELCRILHIILRTTQTLRNLKIRWLKICISQKAWV